MNTNTLKGEWNILKGKVKEKWGKFTDDDLSQISGKKDQLLGKLQQRYGYAEQKAQEEMDEWEKSCSSCSSDEDVKDFKNTKNHR